MILHKFVVTLLRSAWFWKFHSPLFCLFVISKFQSWNSISLMNVRLLFAQHERLHSSWPSDSQFMFESSFMQGYSFSLELSQKIHPASLYKKVCRGSNHSLLYVFIPRVKVEWQVDRNLPQTTLCEVRADAKRGDPIAETTSPCAQTLIPTLCPFMVDSFPGTGAICEIIALKVLSFTPKSRDIASREPQPDAQGSLRRIT